MPAGIPHSVFLSWDEDDQDKALAYRREQATVCTGCGTRRAEWEADRFAYVAQSHQCPGCEVLSQEQDNVPPKARGVHSYLVPRAFATVPDEGPTDGL